MSKNKFMTINLITVLMMFGTMFWVYPLTFMNEHPFVFGFMSVTLVLLHWVNFTAAANERFDLSITGLGYFVIMEIVMLLQIGNPFPVDLIGCLFGACFLFMVGLVLLLMGDKKEIHTITDEKQEALEENKTLLNDLMSDGTVSFNHPDFDFVLENLASDWHYLEENKDLLTMEDWHHAEKLHKALKKAALHYNQLRAEQRIHAEAPIEDLCIRSENYIETLKQKIEAAHLTQINKLSELHTK